MLNITILGKVQLYLSYKYNDCSIYSKSESLHICLMNFQQTVLPVSVLYQSSLGWLQVCTHARCQLPVADIYHSPFEKTGSLHNKGFHTLQSWSFLSCYRVQKRVVRYPGNHQTTHYQLLWLFTIINCFPFQGNPTRDLICQSVAVQLFFFFLHVCLASLRVLFLEYVCVEVCAWYVLYKCKDFIRHCAIVFSLFSQMVYC